MSPPRRVDQTTCTSCRRAVFFARTAAGRFQPLDPEPHPLGRIAAYKTGTGAWVCRTLTEGEQPFSYELVYIAHAATCLVAPGSAKWLPAGVASFAAAQARRRIQRRDTP